MSKGVTMKQPSILRASALASFIALGMPPAMAQQVHDLGPNLQSVPPDLIQPGVAVAGAPAPNVSPYTQNDADLGDDLQDRDSSGASVAAPARISRVDAAISQAATPPVKDQPGNAAKADKSIRKPAASYESTRHGTERALFERAPVAVPLPVGVERLITLPAPAALHVPSDMDKVTRLEVIDRTIPHKQRLPGQVHQRRSISGTDPVVYTVTQVMINVCKSRVLRVATGTGDGIVAGEQRVVK